MLRPRLRSALLLGLLWGLAASASYAQHRPAGSFYLSARVGFALYQGDLDDNPESRLFGTYVLTRNRGGGSGERVDVEYEGYFGSAGPSFGLEGGYQFAPWLALGLAYHFGDYEQIRTAPNPLDLTQSARFNSTSAVHELQLRLRLLLFAQSRVAPYLSLGGAMAFITPANQNPDAPLDVEEEFDGVGLAPLVGVGLDIKLSPRFALLVEADFRPFFPDDAIDSADFDDLPNRVIDPPSAGFIQDDDADSDMLSHVGLGLRYTFKSPVVPVEVTIAGPDTLLVGEVGTFLGGYNPDATPPLAFAFDLGDGTTVEDVPATDLTADHAYDQTGVYTVSFTGVGPINSDTATKPVVVIAVPPTLACSANPTRVAVGEPVRFSAEVTGTPPFEYFYDFGDGTTSTEPSPSHTFSEPGTYAVTLTVTNEAGTATCPFEIVVVAPPMCSIEELNTVFFDTDSAELDSTARDVLDENVAVLRREAPCCAVITGYAHRCERYAADGVTYTLAPEEQPEALAAARAEAVLAYYVAQGLARERFTTRSVVIGDEDAKCPKTRKQREREEILFAEEDARRAESAPVDCSAMAPGAATQTSPDAPLPDPGASEATDADGDR